MLVHALCKTDRRHSTVHLRIDMAVAFFDGWLYIFQQRLQFAYVSMFTCGTPDLGTILTASPWTRLARTRPCRRLILRKNDIGVEAAGAPSYA